MLETAAQPRWSSPWRAKAEGERRGGRSCLSYRSSHSQTIPHATSRGFERAKRLLPSLASCGGWLALDQVARWLRVPLSIVIEAARRLRERDQLAIVVDADGGYRAWAAPEGGAAETEAWAADAGWQVALDPHFGILWHAPARRAGGPG